MRALAKAEVVQEEGRDGLEELHRVDFVLPTLLQLAVLADVEQSEVLRDPLHELEHFLAHLLRFWVILRKTARKQQAS